MKSLTTVSRALALVLGAAALPYMAHAQQAPDQSLERIEITGSAIKRVEQEGPAPVEIITKKDIQRTGATSVNELIKFIPSIDIVDQGELTSNSPSGSGTANIRLRGLSENNTLVLLNGRRLPVNGLYDASGAGAAVDVNMIPIAAIERIEILKDGGSAIYGADAVAGVFNIITRKDYQGIEAGAGYGTSSRHDGTEKNATVSAGFGDLNADRWNVLVSGNLFKRDPIYRDSRTDSSQLDYRSQGYGDYRSGFSPTGNVVDPNSGAYVGIPYQNCPPANLGKGNVCRFNFNGSVLTAYNGADRYDGLALANFQFTPTVRGFAEVLYSHSSDHFNAQPVPDYFSVPLANSPNAAQLTPYIDNLNYAGTGVPASSPCVDYNTNTMAAPCQVLIAGRFMQGGPRMTDRTGSLENLVVGMEGTTNKIDWKWNISRGVSKVTNQDHNYYNANLWYTATGSGALDPTSGTNDPALVNSLKVSPMRTGQSTIESFNGQIGGDLFKLPAGEVQYAVGTSFWRETLTDNPDPLLQQGLVVGDIKQAGADASRNAKAVFAEFAVPILKNVDSQIAARWDSYPGATQTSPKFAVKWQAVPNFLLRASYTASFRVAELKQLYGSQEQGAGTLTDPGDCAIVGIPNCGTAGAVNIFEVNGSNPNLQPEKGKTFNFGLVWDLTSALSATVDYWGVHKTNEISTPTISTALANGDWTLKNGRISVFTTLQNFAESWSRGVDVDTKLRIPGTLIGTFTTRFAATYYLIQATRAGATDPWADYNATFDTPRWRDTLQLISESGPWTTTMAIRGVSGFADTDNAALRSTARQVGAYDETDLQVQYEGFKHWTVVGGAMNVFDRMPPFSITGTSNNLYPQMGFAELYTNRGRFYYANLKYTFK